MALHNLYGPTEAAIYATYWACDQEQTEARVPIGKPIANTQIYILDEAGQPVPIGVAGEIHIGGEGVARGYLNRPELTQEKFIPDPFSAREGARMYRTGDLGRWRPDGAIEYLGRNDFQVKIRGLRIELGEIEARLTELPQVREAVVLAREDHPGDKRLVAYWTAQGDVMAASASHAEAESGAGVTSRETERAAEDRAAEFAQVEPAVEALREHLTQTLPAYMAPSAFVKLEVMPLTPNGKVDRQALPAPEADAFVVQAYEAPQGETEEALAAIWQDLLGVEKVGRHDNFFDLGGHSLLAVQLLARIRQSLGQEVTLKELFAAPTVAQTAQRLQAADVAMLAPIEVADRSARLLLSWSQQRLWFLEQLEDLGSAYHLSAALRLSGALDVAALQRALDVIVDRHEVLRTVFVRSGAEADAIQQILPATAFALTRRDLSALDDAEQQTALSEALHEATQRRFDLETGPLFRAELFKLRDAEHVLHLCMHHIVSDGWSIGVLVDELTRLYGTYHEGKENPLEPLPIQYADYAQWQRQWLSKEKLGEQLAFWQEALTGTPVLLDLPTDRPRPAVQSYAGAAIEFSLDKGVSDGLNALARRHGATLFMVLQAGWSVLMGRLSGQDDVVIGTPVANRRRRELEGLVGFFVNTLALRTRLDAQETVSDLLARVKEQTLEAYNHQDVPFEQVVEALRPERSLSHSPVFQTMLVLQNAPDAELSLAGLTLAPEPLTHESTHFDLTLSLEETANGLQGALEYSTALFDRETVERWLGHLKVLLGAMVADEQQQIKHLPLLSERERDQVLRLFNDTQADYPREALIHERFEQHAEAQPDAVAVVHEDDQLSYAELNTRANQLAHRLRSLTDDEGQPVLRPDTRVAICVERSLEMVVGLLGILKAGGAYVPVDPAYPEDRIAYILQDAGAPILLTQTHLEEKLAHALSIDAGEAADERADATATAAARETPVVVDLDAAATYAGQPDTNISARETGQSSANLAYVIYTSGSTGLPKGVMVEHASLSNLMQEIRQKHALAAGDRLLQFMSFAFDAAVQEIFGSLSSGAMLVLRNEAWISDGPSFWQLCREHGITVLHLPAAFWQQLLHEASIRQCQALRLVIIGGERVESSVLKRWFDCAPGHTVLLNEYGPTETTVTASIEQVIDPETSDGSIGKPIANTHIYILDEAGQPVPIGVAGEIHIGGEGVARGYLNRPELTEEKFIPDPFSERTGARMYRTGDLGRWRADGAIAFIGRNDFQVKIRGLRIELGEIEARLTELPQVREAVVLAREDQPGDKRLVAYWTVQGDAMAASASHAEAESGSGVMPREAGMEADASRAESGVDTLREHLTRTLPAYMVPSAFVKLEVMPLTPNGKVDRQALPVPDADAFNSQAYEMPVGETEEVLAGIWQELLGVEKVGRHDEFFDLGGHSLLMTRLLNQIEAHFEVSISFADIFRCSTLKAMAELIVETQINALN